MPYSRLAVVLAALAPLALGAQQPVPPQPPRPTPAQRPAADSLARRGADSLARAAADTDTLVVRRDSAGGGPRLQPRLKRDSLRLPTPASLAPLGSLRPDRASGAAEAARRIDSLRARTRRQAEESFRSAAAARLGASGAVADATATQPAVGEEARPQTMTNRAMDIFGDYADLGLVLNTRLEAKVEKNRNERCTTAQLLNPAFNCAGTFQPQFDFQFNVRTGGVVADRIHVNVDYDSQREFDASNNINVFYEGKSDELIERLEVGNVFFQPPNSRFITGGIPSGNYGLQAKGQVGPMRFSSIVAQQKGNKVAGRTFRVGEQTLQEVTTDLEDFRFEPRRFFFVLDPRQLPGYPSIDILSTSAMQGALASLPSDRRPAQVRVYRLRVGQATTDVLGPRFTLLDDVTGLPRTDGPYELLQPGTDYYMDPSQLWFALKQPLSYQTDRLVVAYTVGAGVPNRPVGGDPVLQASPTGDSLYARLVFDQRLSPRDSAFYKEIRSVYRIGGADMERLTTTLRVGTGPGGAQETPRAGTAQTYLQMLGLSQATNSAAFDVDNRLWPRPGDPVNTANGGQRVIPDQFLVFPSLRPFAAVESGGRIQSGNIPNDTIYTTSIVDLNSARRPPAAYFMRASFQARGGGDFGSLMLGSVQLSRNSERLLVDGVPLRRDVDYEIDYELGRVSFTRPDTLFRTPRNVTVQYEENPLFTAAPTSIFGLASQFDFTNGRVDFVAISQNQKTTFNRPPLGFEPASSLVAGVNGNFTFDAAPLSRLVEKLPFVGATTSSQIAVSAELATSRPQPNAAGVAYVESFEGEGGTTIPLAEAAWYYSSVPKRLSDSTAAVRTGLIPSDLFTEPRAATLAWQNTGSLPFRTGEANFTVTQFTIGDIDPQVRLTGRGIQTPESVLWLSLYPRNIGGAFDFPKFKWTFGDQPAGARWRSLRTPLSPSGIDLSRAEYLEFWALVDPNVDAGKNPTLVFDFGDISENSLTFSPETLTVRIDTVTRSDGQRVVFTDSLYAGRQRAGYDSLDTERNPITRLFDVNNDIGLSGDRAPRLTIVDQIRGTVRDTANVAVCRTSLNDAFVIGDARANCTVGNSRLDEEDLDADLRLNAKSTDDVDQVLRYVINLNDSTLWSRPGLQSWSTREKADGTRDTVRMQWQLIRVPFNATSDSVGQPSRRLIRSLRVTMVSGRNTAEDEMTQTVIARLRMVGSPWTKRQEKVLAGIVGNEQAGGFQIAGIVGTQDSTAGLVYQPPPGVTDAADNRQASLENQLIQINERSLRLLAGGDQTGTGDAIPLNRRAEAYYRFPEGQKNFMGYRELRVWAKGRGRTRNGAVSHGWNNGELEFFVKIGRDPSNFYLYRRPIAAGDLQSDWRDVRVQFERLYQLRARVQNNFLQPSRRFDTGCSAADSAFFRDNPDTRGATPFVACAPDPATGGTYMVYTLDPNTTAPNLAQVQELALGMLRVKVDEQTSDHITFGDTLEVWADDIRLTGVVDDPGYAGQFALALNAGDVGNVAINMSRRDPNFRQLGEAPSYLQDDAIDIRTQLQLDRLLPRALGYSIPLAITHSRTASDPFFLAGGDLRGSGIQGLRTPKGATTAYRMSLRRNQPFPSPVAGALLDNLSLDASLLRGDSRSSYVESGSKAYDVSASYAVQARTRAWALPTFVNAVLGRLPAWMQRTEALRALRQARLRWNPSSVRVSSNLGRSDARITNFVKPAELLDPSDTTDPGRTVSDLRHLWRNQAGLELRPFGALSASWNLTSLRDLRHYERDLVTDTVSVGAVAAAERERLAGVDLGLERERTMNTGISFQPVVAAWLRPRVEVSSSFRYLRDPNTRQLLREFDDSLAPGGYRLPRRLDNAQNVGTGVTVDVGRLLAPLVSTRPMLRRIADIFEPVDLNFSRTLSSAYDGTPFTPGLGYQLSLGGIDEFRSQRGRLASSASLSNTMQMRSSLSLPLGFSLQQEIRRSFNRSYYRLSEPRQQSRENETLMLPRLTLGWNYRPTWKLLAKVAANVGATVGYEPSETRSFAPSLTSDTAQAERGRTETTAIPVRASITWAFLGNLTTGVNWRQSKSIERRPGAQADGESRDFGVDMARAFQLPKKWNLSDQVTARVNYQRASTTRFIPTAAGTAAAYQANNGRTAFNFNADTQLAENLTGSLVLSRIVNFDNLLNRRYSQLVMTAVFQLSFQAGEMR